MKTVTDKMADLVNTYPHLKTMNPSSAANTNNNTQEGDQTILPLKPPMFKLAELKSINNDTILLEVKPENVPTTICGDGCATNMKASTLLETGYGLKSPFSRCTSCASAGAIRRLCMSANSSQIDAESIYENLRSILKHFANSPRSSKLLNNTLKISAMSNIHLLSWGSTGMAGILDACVRASKIILPFLDTIVTCSIRPEETRVVANPEGRGSYICFKLLPKGCRVTEIRQVEFMCDSN